MGYAVEFDLGPGYFVPQARGTRALPFYGDRVGWLLPRVWAADNVSGYYDHKDDYLRAYWYPALDLYKYAARATFHDKVNQSYSGRKCWRMLALMLPRYNHGLNRWRLVYRSGASAMHAAYYAGVDRAEAEFRAVHGRDPLSEEAHPHWEGPWYREQQLPARASKTPAARSAGSRSARWSHVPRRRAR